MTHNQQGTHKPRAPPWIVKGSYPTCSTPTLRPAPERWGPQTSGFENRKSLGPWAEQRAVANWEMTLKGFLQTHSPQGSAQRQLLKNVQTLRERDSLANLRVLGNCWDTIWEWRCWWVPLAYSLLQSWSGAIFFSTGCHLYLPNGGAPSLFSPSALLRLVDVIFILLL